LLLGSPSRVVPIVDWTSFVIIRCLTMDRAFTFDRDCRGQGHVIPEVAR
jgi:hypothetical protein